MGSVGQDWPLWAPRVAAAAASALGVGVLAGWSAGYRSLASLPHAALPGGLILLVGAAVALATFQAWGSRLPRRVVDVSAWTVAGLALVGSCWLLLDLSQLALTGEVTDRDGNSAWTGFLQRLALTAVGSLFAATALSWRRVLECAGCGHSSPALTVGVRHPPPAPAPGRTRRIAYAGCLSWLPYASAHSLGALGVPGIEPDGFRPSIEMLVVFWLAIGLAVFLLLGLVRPWGMAFPRWTLWLAGRRVPRWLPLLPVSLIAPTFVVYGLGSVVYVAFLATGVLDLRSGATIGPLGFGQPFTFTAYGLALTTAAVSYHVRTRPTETSVTACCHQLTGEATRRGAMTPPGAHDRRARS